MKDVDVKMEGGKENFDYSDFWEDGEEEDVERKMKDFSKGIPRRGLNGKYIKKKNNVSMLRIKKSYGKYFKGLND